MTQWKIIHKRIIEEKRELTFITTLLFDGTYFNLLDNPLFLQKSNSIPNIYTTKVFLSLYSITDRSRFQSLIPGSQLVKHLSNFTAYIYRIL